MGKVWGVLGVLVLAACSSETPAGYQLAVTADEGACAGAPRPVALELVAEQGYDHPIAVLELDTGATIAGHLVTGAGGEPLRIEWGRGTCAAGPWCISVQSTALEVVGEAYRFRLDLVEGHDLEAPDAARCALACETL